MSFWRSSDDNIRWLVVIGLVQALLSAFQLYHYGIGNLRWVEPLVLALACLAAAPLEGSGLRWRQQLRTPNGLLFIAAMTALLGLMLWQLIHR